MDDRSPSTTLGSSLLALNKEQTGQSIKNAAGGQASDEAVPTRHTFLGFSRTSTFGIFGSSWDDDSSYARSLSEALGLNYESDEAWTRHLIDSYVYGEEKGSVGDIPMPAGFAQEYRFWRLILISSAMGIVMGLAAVGFMNMADYVPTLWVNNGDFESAADCQYNAGKIYWIAITGGTGLLVGLIRWYFEYPSQIPGIFKEINDCHVHPEWSPLTFLLSAISLAGGASLGPEQALSNLGGGIGTFLKDHTTLEHSMDQEDRKLLVLSGMSSALGALFPTPLLGVLMIHELGNPPRAYMESIIILSSGAIVAFVVYYWLVGFTEVDVTAKNPILSIKWDFELSQCGTAVLMGLVSGVLSLVSVIFIGVCKQTFVRIRMRLERNAFLQQVVPPMVGGIIVGAVNYALPLTVGGGSMVSKAIVTFGRNYVGTGGIPDDVIPLIPYPIPEGLVGDPGSVSSNLLLCTLFGKMFVLGISMNSGFIGGFVFPTLTMGIICGTLCFQFFDYLPLGMCIACFVSAVPAGICPMPFTLATLTIFVFFFGLYQTVPIYIATLVSYTVVCGSGIFTALQLAALKRAEEAEAARQAPAVGGGSSVDQDATRAVDQKSFVLNQYLGQGGSTSTSKRKTHTVDEKV